MQRLTTGQMDKTVGAVTYALMLDAAGGIRSDITVARLGQATFQVGANGQLDLDYLRRDAPADGSVQVRDITGAPAASACGVRWPVRSSVRSAPTTCRTRV